MIYLRAHTIHTRKGGKGRRGSVIVLVVAVLALLAVIGTVYIVSARSERSGAIASETATNLDNAQKAVNDQVLQTVGDAPLDAVGNIGGLATAGPFGFRMARSWDMPEGNPLAFFSAPPLPFSASYNVNARDESWLVDSVYRYNAFLEPGNPPIFNPYTGTYPVPGPSADIRYNNVSLLTPAVFDPSTGQYDIQLYNNGAGYLPNFSSANMFNVVADPSWAPAGLTGLILPNATATSRDADSYINLLPFSDASGVRYRFGIRIVDLSALANLNVGTVYASAPSGTYGWMVHNNTFYTGYALNSPAVPTIFNSTATAFGGGIADNPASLNSSMGRAGAYGGAPYPAAPPEYAWSQAAFRFERPDIFGTTPFDPVDELELRANGDLGTLVTPRAASAVTGGMIWPNTLGNRNPGSSTVVFNPYRGGYTTASYSRALRPFADPVDGSGVSTAYELAPATGNWVYPPPGGAASTRVWPGYPAPVAANPDFSVYTNIVNPEKAVETLATAATNIATAMELIPQIAYSTDESRAFAANYITTRWNSWLFVPPQKTLNGTPYNVYNLTAGPSFIDGLGICVRTGVATSSGGNFTSPPAYAGAPTLIGSASHAYLGFAAQPFINEVAISTEFVAADNAWKEDDSAIELYNPFDVALSLNDYKLSVNGTLVDFTGKDQWIPPRGYFVLYETTGGLNTLPTPPPNTAIHTDSGTMGAPFKMSGAKQIYLMRKYFNRTNTAEYAAVDAYGVKNIADLTNTTTYAIPATSDPPPAPQIEFEARPNNDDGTATTALTRWVGVVHDPAVAEAAHKNSGAAPDALTLGSANDKSGAVMTPIPLYDRTLELYLSQGVNTDFQRLLLNNVSDFSRILRIANEFNPNDGTPAGNGAISAQLALKIAAAATDPNVMKSDFKEEAEVRFDFRPDLSQWGAAATGGFNPGDPRAARLLQCLAFTDRVSDFSIDLGDNNTVLGGLPSRGISKLRIPGLINVNTAPPEVLATIPAMNPSFGGNLKLIGAIMAYRLRTNTADPRIPNNAGFNLQTTSGLGYCDFSNQSQFPGYGVRSIGELEIPVTLWAKSGGATPLTLYDRQTLWGSLSNSLTVRSDTFVLYGYLEAVKQNPRYNGNVVSHLARADDGNFDNSTDWYLNVTNNAATPKGAITDDPNNSNAPLLRLARRRWVAIIDRSNADFSRYAIVPNTPNPAVSILDPRFTQPTIIAAKDLPR